jgi:hypothetical protein
MTMVQTVEFYLCAPEALSVTHQIEKLAFHANCCEIYHLARQLVQLSTFRSPAGEFSKVSRDSDIFDTRNSRNSREQWNGEETVHV